MNTVLRLLPAAEDIRYVLFPSANHVANPNGWVRGGIEDAGWPYAIVMTTLLADQLIERLLKRVNDPLIPLVSLLPDDRHWFDASGHDCWDRARTIVERLKELPGSIRSSTNAEDIILARMFSRDAEMTATYSPARQSMVSYDVLGGSIGNPAEAANALTRRGCLSRDFFDRFHICPQCRSSALNIREECHKCRSPHINEEVIVHHFRCGYEGLEKKFKRSNGDLQCPKCNDKLRHIGLDYDKPGSVVVCMSCSAANDGTAVGFVCMHCKAKHDAAQVPVLDWYSYQMTSLGSQILFAGGVATQNPTNGPDNFKLVLQQSIQHQEAFGTPFQVLKGVFENSESIRSRSIRAAKQTEDLVIDVLRSALRPVDTVTPCENGVLILLPHMREADAGKVIAEIERRMSEVVLHDPGLRFDALSRLEAEQLLEEA